MLCLPQLVDPASYFLCCLPLSFGAKLLMWPHLILSLYAEATALEKILNGDVGAFGAGQVFDAVWSLLGIPILAAGLWGIYHRVEPHVRFYFYYLLISVLIDVYYIVDLFLLQDSCVHLKLAAAANGGHAFACGVARSISASTAVVTIAIAFYMIYIVWSWCEDVEGSAATLALSDLLSMADGKRLTIRVPDWQPDLDIVGSSLDAASSIASGASIVYGAVSNTVRKDINIVEHFVEDNLDGLEDYAVGRHEF